MSAIKTWRKFHVVVVQLGGTAKKSTKNCDAHAKLLLCLSKPLLAFLPFSLPSSKLSLKPATFKLPACFESRVWTTENYCWGILTITQLVEPSCTPAPGAFIYREHWAQRERKSARAASSFFSRSLILRLSPRSERLGKEYNGKALLTHSTSSTVKTARTVLSAVSGPSRSVVIILVKAFFYSCKFFTFFGRP